MDANRAAEVLRELHQFYRSGQVCLELTAEAVELGAQALEAWAWQQAREADVEYEPSSDKWHCCGFTAGTPLAAVLDAMEKEGKG